MLFGKFMILPRSVKNLLGLIEWAGIFHVKEKHIFICFRSTNFSLSIMIHPRASELESWEIKTRLRTAHYGTSTPKEVGRDGKTLEKTNFKNVKLQKYPEF